MEGKRRKKGEGVRVEENREGKGESKGKGEGVKRKGGEWREWEVCFAGFF